MLYKIGNCKFHKDYANFIVMLFITVFIMSCFGGGWENLPIGCYYWFFIGGLNSIIVRIQNRDPDHKRLDDARLMKMIPG